MYVLKIFRHFDFLNRVAAWQGLKKEEVYLSNLLVLIFLNLPSKANFYEVS